MKKLMNLYRFVEYFDNGQTYEDYELSICEILIVAHNREEAMNIAKQSGYNPEASKFTHKIWLFEDDASSGTELSFILSGVKGPARFVEQASKLRFDQLPHYIEMSRNAEGQ